MTKTNIQRSALCILFCLSSLLVKGQTLGGIRVAPTGTGTLFQIAPQAVPTSSTWVTTSDAYLQTFTIVNTTAGALTFTLADRQSSPVAVMSSVSIAANSIAVVYWAVPYYCPNGFTVAASSTGLNFYATWRQP